jgi:hypothetical protein
MAARNQAPPVLEGDVPADAERSGQAAVEHQGQMPKHPDAGQQPPGGEQ